MDKKTLFHIMGFALLLMFIWEPYALAQCKLSYKDRGNRYEGVKPKPVSGYGIELISVLVNYKEEVEQIPAQLRLKFYLACPINVRDVHLTVRELDNRYCYWMDRVTPQKAWQAGFENAFDWSTEEVIQHLEGVKMYNLGVVVRLGKPVPSMEEKVAPVIFYHSQPPSTVQGYLFTLKACSDARLTSKFFREGEAEPLFQTTRIVWGGRPFTVRWDSSGVPEGPCKLVARGYSLDTNDPIVQIIHFYHQPNVK